MIDNAEISELIAKHFSLQWCRDNLVIPLGIRPDPIRSSSCLIIGIANFQYLGAVGNTIKGHNKSNNAFNMADIKRGI